MSCRRYEMRVTNSDGRMDADAVIPVEWIRRAVTVIDADDCTTSRIGRDVRTVKPAAGPVKGCRVIVSIST